MKKISIVCVSVAFVLTSWVSVFAASVTFKSESSVGTGSVFPVEVFITAPTAINAVNVVFTVSPGLEIADFSDGNSIVNMWVDKLRKTGPTTWSASGIIPGGYTGKDGRFITLYIRGDAAGVGSVSVGEGSEAYSNNGQATTEKIVLTKASFTLVEGKVNPAPDYTTDTESPETFLPVIGKVPTESGDMWAVTFSTQDKGSGIARYEVAESAREIRVESYGTLEWKVAESPYILADQGMKSWIHVKAVDKKGQTTIQSLPPQRSWFASSIQYILIGLAIVACLYVLFKFITRRRL